MLADPQSLQLTLLAVIAGATAIMAIVQIALLIAGVRLARRVQDLADTVENDIRPALGKLERVSDEATRVVTAAADLAEQSKAFLDRVGGRVDGLMSAARLVLGGRGMAAFAGVRAAVESFVGGNGPAPATGGQTPPGPRSGDAVQR
ncbi:MAG: hypothetical protein F4Y45_16060 [Acidobacteria bacterium]|nr:hypothetical protein [Acidobacteriota bacterium]MYD72294.1 hypothetical protein [Acidobacteriota bacterium]MYJ04197.1 hypothetical protein [Acidobacteriota bacterium]